MSSSMLEKANKIRGVILTRVFSILSIKENWVLFESYKGMSYSCNPKAIFLELGGRGLGDYRCFWSFNDPEKFSLNNSSSIKRGSILYYYVLARSKYCVTNVDFVPLKKYQENQIRINTQHGIPYKKMGIHRAQKGGLPRIRSNSSKDKVWDVLVSPSSYATRIFRECYLYSGKVLEYGYPRNDVFFRCENISFLRRKYISSVGKKIILYAPTWRDGDNNSFHEILSRIDLARLYSELNEDYVIVLRFHHLVDVAQFDINDFDGFYVDLSSSTVDVQELLLICDILVTDYSSMMFDGAMLDKHQIFFTYDYDLYHNDTRGSYMELKDRAPGPIVDTDSRLISAIKSHNKDYIEYSQKREIFRNEYCSGSMVKNGTSARFVVDDLFFEGS